MSGRTRLPPDLARGLEKRDHVLVRVVRCAHAGLCPLNWQGKRVEHHKGVAHSLPHHHPHDLWEDAASAIVRMGACAATEYDRQDGQRSQETPL